VSVDVTNSGTRDGDEVVQLYLSHPSAGVPVPIRQLAGFRRIHLRAGQTKSVSFKLTRNQFAAYDDGGKPFLPGGEFRIHAGGGQTGGLATMVELPRSVTSKK
jgi:beta-glucosidase